MSWFKEINAAAVWTSVSEYHPAGKERSSDVLLQNKLIFSCNPWMQQSNSFLDGGVTVCCWTANGLTEGAECSGDMGVLPELCSTMGLNIWTLPEHLLCVCVCVSDLVFPSSWIFPWFYIMFGSTSSHWRSNSFQTVRLWKCLYLLPPLCSSKALLFWLTACVWQLLPAETFRLSDLEEGFLSVWRWMDHKQQDGWSSQCFTVWWTSELWWTQEAGSSSRNTVSH